MPDHVEPDFEWDEGKSDRALRRHGFDFKFASRVFANENYLEDADDRRDYGEQRYVVVGVVEGIFVTVVYTSRKSRKRIVSTWQSSRKERDEYARAFGYKGSWPSQLD